MAGWLHDCAKEMKLEEMQGIIDEQNLQVDEYMRSSRALLHGPAGSIMAKTVYGIKIEISRIPSFSIRQDVLKWNYWIK